MPTVIIPIESEPWRQFLLSGITGGAAALINGTYTLNSGTGEFEHQSSGYTFRQVDPTHWALEDAGGFAAAGGEGGAWPWECTWTPDAGGAAGDYVFSPPPAIVIPIEGAVAAVAAALTTALTGTNNDLIFTARTAGRIGNSISLTYVNPAANNVTLAVTAVGLDISVRLATSGAGAITSTAAQVKAAIEASEASNALVSVANAVGNNGSGVVTAMAKTLLTGGAGGQAPPPSVIPMEGPGGGAPPSTVIIPQ